MWEEGAELLEHRLALGRLGIEVVEDGVTEGMTDGTQRGGREVGAAVAAKVGAGEGGLQCERVGDAKLTVDDDARCGLFGPLDL